MYVNETAEINGKIFIIDTCKYCQSKHIIKYGTQNGVQYFLCKDCNHKFATVDTIPKMRYNTKDIGRAVEMLYEGKSLNEIRSSFIQQDGSYISKTTPYNWVHRFTTLAKNEAIKYKPDISNVWVSIVQLACVNGTKVRLWDLIDTRTRFLISSHISKSRTSSEAEILMEKALKYTGVNPGTIITRFEEIDSAYYTELLNRNFPFKIDNNYAFTERYCINHTTRIRVLNNLKSIDAAKKFIDGWAIHYNFFSPNSQLKDVLPAEAAGIKFPYKNWCEIIEQPYEITARVCINRTKDLPTPIEHP